MPVEMKFNVAPAAAPQINLAAPAAAPQIQLAAPVAAPQIQLAAPEPAAILPDPDTIKMFFGQIPRWWTEGDCTTFFQQYGRVYQVFLLRDKDSQQSKGCGFVTYFHKRDALTAQSKLHNTVTIDGMLHRIQMRPAVEKDRRRNNSGSSVHGASTNSTHTMNSGHTPLASATEPLTRLAECSHLFVGNIPSTFTDDQLLETFQNFGVVMSATVCRDKPTNASKRFGFVTFTNCGDAQRAIQAMNGIPIGDRRLCVELKKG
uniref:RRM domain-containing protein n=1 Tax=Steinernema glaseri TaxID=37863 RepID=A0A1I8ALG7_9BILA